MTTPKTADPAALAPRSGPNPPQGDSDPAAKPSRPERVTERDYLRSQAAAAIVKAARRWYDAREKAITEEMRAEDNLTAAVRQYEALLPTED